MKAIYPGNVLGGAPLYQGFTLGDVLNWTLGDFSKSNYPGLRAIRLDGGLLQLAADLADPVSIASGTLELWY